MNFEELSLQRPLDPFETHAIFAESIAETCRQHVHPTCLLPLALQQRATCPPFLAATAPSCLIRLGRFGCHPAEPVGLQPEVKKVDSILDYCQDTFATLHNRKECIIKFLTPAPGAIIAPQGCGPAAS